MFHLTFYFVRFTKQHTFVNFSILSGKCHIDISPPYTFFLLNCDMELNRD
jgi:hypothetical protein